MQLAGDMKNNPATTIANLIANLIARTIAPLVLVAVMLQTVPRAFSQKPKADPSAVAPVQQTQGAVSTGGVHTAILDSEKRPITAGGFVDTGPIVNKASRCNGALFRSE